MAAEQRVCKGTLGLHKLISETTQYVTVCNLLQKLNSQNMFYVCNPKNEMVSLSLSPSFSFESPSGRDGCWGGEGTTARPIVTALVTASVSAFVPSFRGCARRRFCEGCVARPLVTAQNGTARVRRARS